MSHANIGTSEQHVNYSKISENTASSKLSEVIKSIRNYVQNIKLSNPFHYVLSKFKALTKFLRICIENIIPLQWRVNQIVDAHRKNEFEKFSAQLNLLKLRFENKSPEKLKKLSDEIDLKVTKKHEKTPSLYNSSIFSMAYEHKEMDFINQLVKSGVDVNITDKYGRTLLFIASQYNDIEMVTTLLEHGADVNKAANNGRTALFVACEMNNVKMIETLFKYGADVNKTDNDGEIALFTATEKNKRESVDALLKNKLVDPNIVNHDGCTVLFKMVSPKGSNPEILLKLLQDSRIQDIPDITGITAFKKAIMNSKHLLNPAIINAFLAVKNLDLEHVDNFGNTLFEHAILLKSSEVVEAILKDSTLKNNINVNQPNKHGNTALMLVARHSSKLMPLFIKYGKTDSDEAEKALRFAPKY